MIFKSLLFIIYSKFIQNPKHIHRARAFASFGYSSYAKKKLKKSNYPYSLFEGAMGRAIFYRDLFNPFEARLPFFDCSPEQTDI